MPYGVQSLLYWNIQVTVLELDSWQNFVFPNEL